MQKTRDMLLKNRFLIGWWHNGCGKMNLNGLNNDIQLNTIPGSIMPYTGIVWYDFFKNTEGRGTMLEPDGGLWASFKATEMRIYTNIDLSYFGK